MGIDIDRTEFTDEDYSRFTQRMRADLDALAHLLARPGFGVGAPSIGAELEMHLVDAEMRPAPVNQAVQASADDLRVALELNRFNLELNARPTMLAGRPFAAMRAEFDGALGVVRAAAAEHGARVAMVGILPTLRAEDLAPSSRTPLKRFAALARQLRGLRGHAFEVRINGEDPLRMECDDVTLEGANTSWQLHLRVNPEAFAAHYNAAQLVTAPLLAMSGTSPFFVGHRLWEETRIALFKQAVDPRLDLSADWHPAPRVGLGTGWARQGALELFRESAALHVPILPLCGREDVDAILAAGGSPKLEQLRLHHGTVWSWNRAVYDAVDGAAGAHLRIELRASGAGPTLTDMLANSAFALGLTLALAPSADDWMPRMPFAHARYNLYRAAELGMRAELLWPDADSPSPRPRPARDLIAELLPLAARGLADAGVDEDDFAPLLAVIEARASSGRTGATWQRQRLAALRRTLDLDDALAAMLSEYLELSWSDAPVHTWP